MHSLKPFFRPALALFVLIAGCAQPAHMSRDEVIGAANRAATEAAYSLGDYGAPDAHYQFTRKDKTWTVFYVLKPPTPPGGHFQVRVDDQTGRTKVMRGE